MSGRPPRRAFASLRGYAPSWVRGDLAAGLTVWAVLVPQALAYASIAGVSPVVGLYAAPGALLLYALLGTSRVLIVGPMAATAILSAATVSGMIGAHGERFAQLTAGLAIIAGLTAIAAGLLRLGFIAEFISQPVLKGFVIGLALMVIVGQLPKLFGLPASHGDFFEQTWNFLRHLPDTDPAALAIGAGSLAVILAAQRLSPHLPGSLIAVAGGIIAVKALAVSVPTVGEVTSGLPALGVPDVSLADVGQLAPAAIGIVLVAFAESLGAAKTYAGREELDTSRELVALGAANSASGLSGGMIVSGSLSKTAVNAASGARSQASALLAAALTLVALLFLTGLFADLPQATLAAVVIAAVSDLIDVQALRDLYAVYSRRLGAEFGWVARPDFLSAIAALLGVLVFGTLAGLFIGIGISLVLLIYRASRPHVAHLGRMPGEDGTYRDITRHPKATEPNHVAVLRVESGLYFANAHNVRQEILDAALRPNVRAVILDAEAVPFIDVTAARVLVETMEDLRAEGQRLVVACYLGQVRDVLRCITDEPDLTASHPTVDAAIRAL